MKDNNLLEDTLDMFKTYNLSEKDIIFIGSSCGEYYCSWEKFKQLANQKYKRQYACETIATDLIIVFKNGIELSITEYDGLQDWYIHIPFIMANLPVELKSITNLFGDRQTLSEINQPEEYI